MTERKLKNAERNVEQSTHEFEHAMDRLENRVVDVVNRPRRLARRFVVQPFNRLRERPKTSVGLTGALLAILGVGYQLGKRQKQRADEEDASMILIRARVDASDEQDAADRLAS